MGLDSPSLERAPQNLSKLLFDVTFPTRREQIRNFFGEILCTESALCDTDTPC